jgi:addiction module HigA family antidote
MTRSSRNEYQPDSVSLPGETILEVLESQGMSQADLAQRTGRPRKTINEIVKGKAALTPDTALQLERVLGVPASFWNNLESYYRDYLARRVERDLLKTHVNWLREFPLQEMIQWRWVAKNRDKVEQVRSVLGFFGVASPSQWREVFARPQAVFRKSLAYSSTSGAVAAWLRRGELDAQEIETNQYSRRLFREALSRARSLTVEPPEVFQEQLVNACAEAGVAVVFLRTPKGCRASGAARWLAPDRALILLSLRYKSDDQLWFSFFHEACHILQRVKRKIFLDDKPRGAGEEEEEDANQFAADFLIPPDAYESFANRTRFSKRAIRSFANSIGIAPGIVVGRLQHDGLLPYNQCNDLKQRFEWVDKLV